MNRIIWYDMKNRISEPQRDDIQKVLRLQQLRVDAPNPRKQETEPRVTDLLERSLVDTGLAR